MVTSGAADVAGLGAKLGRLAVGRAADIVVLARQGDDHLRVGVRLDPGRRTAGDDRRGPRLRAPGLGAVARGRSR